MSQKDITMEVKLHIGIFGKRNSGKSTLINALIGQNEVLDSSLAEATMDPVYKTIEIEGIGSCVLIDTAGFDDSTYEAQLRVEKTKYVMEKTDVALIVCSEEDITQEAEWAKEFKTRRASVIMIINKIDQISNTDKIRKKILEAVMQEPIKISAISSMGIEVIKEEILRNILENFEARRIAGKEVREGDIVLLITGQKIHPIENGLSQLQVQIMNELLAKKCIVITCTSDNQEKAITSLGKPPKYIIADSKMIATSEAAEAV